MSSDSVIYNGKITLKEHFRVFVYGENESKKLCNNYEEYEMAIKSGQWSDNLPIVEISTNKKPIKRKKTPYTTAAFEVQKEDQDYDI